VCAWYEGWSGTRLVSERADVTGKLKRLVVELSLGKRVLKDVAEGNVWSAPQVGRPLSSNKVAEYRLWTIVDALESSSRAEFH